MTYWPLYNLVGDYNFNLISFKELRLKCSRKLEASFDQKPFVLYETAFLLAGLHYALHEFTGVKM